ncbi:hypothetical protein TSAR_010366 [Trichomalopsis sarcophagae]|uniref:Uncharacterized protein n=1 Tax=Trichomalopsis sarcophagae TaxID=543379 RepID=A0A232F819_9HYME|nr:hypothetical protein TSAR_010366 [Trichomalopsis sarcophagae]
MSSRRTGGQPSRSKSTAPRKNRPTPRPPPPPSPQQQPPKKAYSNFPPLTKRKTAASSKAPQRSHLTALLITY